MCRPIGSVRNEGGGGSEGLTKNHTCTGPWHLCFPRGPRVGPLKTPLNIKMSFMNCFKLLSITRNKTCYKDKWVTLKTLLVA